MKNKGKDGLTEDVVGSNKQFIVGGFALNGSGQK